MLWPMIPQIQVLNTRLAQAASGCVPSVDVLTDLSTLSSRVCGTLLGGVRVCEREFRPLPF
ncbi:hypothetical protein K0M31_018282 [Melipona bicolor]|uniref:Uncharacterized protein n=1 Tax=Melipona bicolor TaxID=60889 RepID=A0AA40FDK5_9HYME|nr:hypothetical protein K0M31_018282 [Melipona bicolor]